MDREHLEIKSNPSHSFKASLKELARKAEILIWYFCYKIVAGPHKENPAKSANH